VYQSRSPRNKKATLMRRGSVAEHLRLFRGLEHGDFAMKNGDFMAKT
jgi:hypothetical protein